jgi:hypothetical protein
MAIVIIARMVYGMAIYRVLPPVWIVYKSLATAPASQVWSIVGIVAAGVVLMFVARFGLRSTFFQIPRETADSH